MDTSAKYIQMCRAAVEIQGYKQYALGDFNVIDVGVSSIEITDKVTQLIVKRNPHFKSKDIWLPRQDQLQNMLFGKSIQSQFNKLKKPLSIDTIDTWEQVWLSIVMRENYQKTWDSYSKKWVNI